jgi:hypothetical protein
MSSPATSDSVPEEDEDAEPQAARRTHPAASRITLAKDIEVS